MVTDAPPLIRGLAEGTIMVGTISSVALNIEGYPFTRNASKKQLHEMIEPLCDVLNHISRVKWNNPLVLHDLREEYKQILRETEYIPGSEDDITDYTLLVVAKSLKTLALINGEEHLYVEKYSPTENPNDIEKALTRARTIADNMLSAMIMRPAWNDDYRFLMQDPACSGDGVGVGAWMNLTGLVETDRLWYIRELVNMTGMKIRAALNMNMNDSPGFFRIDVPRNSSLRISTAAEKLRNLCKLLYDKELQIREVLMKDTKPASTWKNILRADFDKINRKDDIGEHELPGLISRLVLGISLKNYRPGISAQRVSLELKRLFQHILPAQLRQQLNNQKDVQSIEQARGMLLNIYLKERLKAQLI